MSVGKKLGFSNFEIVDDVGFFSGLWMLWDQNIKVEIVGTSDKSISACVCRPEQAS